MQKFYSCLVQGGRDFFKEKTIEDNPYHLETEEGALWKAGWEREKESQELFFVKKENEDLKKEVRRLFSAIEMMIHSLIEWLDKLPWRRKKIKLLMENKFNDLHKVIDEESVRIY